MAHGYPAMGISRISRDARVSSAWGVLSDILSPLFKPILTMFPRPVWFFALLPISLASPVSVNRQDNAEDYYCGRETYGSPNIVDCHPLLESFANYQDNVQRVFDEEQMRVDDKGSWPGVIGIVGASHLNWVVQVPRYYTLSMYDRPNSRSWRRDGVDLLTMPDS